MSRDFFSLSRLCVKPKLNHQTGNSVGVEGGDLAESRVTVTLRQRVKMRWFKYLTIIPYEFYPWAFFGPQSTPIRPYMSYRLITHWISQSELESVASQKDGLGYTEQKRPIYWSTNSIVHRLMLVLKTFKTSWWRSSAVQDM